MNPIRRALLFPFVLTVCAACLTGPGSAQAVAWVAKHGLTGAQYQTEFTKWTGAPYYLRLINVAGYEVAGSARYAALWEQRSGGWSATHGNSEAGFVQQVNTLRGQGWRPTYFNAFGVGGTAYFNGIFEPTSNTDFVFQPSLTWSEYLATSSSLTADGYRLVDICPFNLGSADYYAVLWEKTRGLSVQTSIQQRQTSAQYQTTFSSLTSQGWRLDWVRGFTIAGDARFTSHWTKLPAADWWWAYHALSAVNFQGAVLNGQYQGYRPTFIAAYTDGGVAQYNAMWIRNGGFGLDVIGKIDDAVSAYLQQYQVPGLTVAISRQGRLVFAKGYGYADQAAGEWVHPLHRFRIASVSKPFCASAMLKLVDDNLVELTNKVFGAGALLGTTYGNGSYTTREKQINVRHLLNHTTGWIGSSDNPIWDNANGNNTAAVIGQALDIYEPSYTPGVHYEYHNVDFCTAARVIERQSGLTFEQYVKDNILAPCGITDMEIGNQTLAGRKPSEVVYYDIAGRDPYVDINPHRMDANGGWIGTALDLLLFCRRVDGDSRQHDVLSSGSITSMRTGSAPNATYGLGWFWDGGRTWYGHNGCMTGTLGWLITREDDIHISAMTNLRPSLDDCAWNLNGVLMGIADDLKTADVWPDFDLFPATNPGFDSWVSAHFDAGAVAQLGLKEMIWGPLADPDGDGQANLEEAYLNRDPLVDNTAFKGTPFATSTDYVYRWLHPISTHGVEGTVVWKSTVDANGTWSTSGIGLSTPPRLLAPIGYQWTDASLPRAGRNTAFMRLDLSAP